MAFSPLILFRLGLIVLTLSFAALGFATASDGTDLLLVMLGLCTFVLAASPVFLQRQYALWHPLTFILPIVFVGVTAKLIYVVAAQNRSQHVQENLLLFQPTSVLIAGAVAMVIAIASFQIGYVALPRIKLPTAGLGRFLNRYWAPGRLLLAVVILVPISTLCFVMLVRETGADLTNLAEFSQKRFLQEDEGAALRVYSLKYWYYRGAYLSRAVFYVMLCWAVATHRSWWSWSSGVIALTGIQSLLVPLFVDNRTGVVLLIVDSIAITSLLSSRVNLTRLVMPVAISVLLISGMLANRSRSGATGAVLERTIAGRDFMDVCKTSHIIHAVPQTLPYLYGETLYGWLFAPIPPRLWPDKPRWTELPFMLDSVFAKRDDLIGKNSMPPGIVAELYLNGGWIAIVLGMVLIGLVFKSFWATFAELRANEFAVLLYALAISRMSLGIFGADLGTGIVKTGLDLLPTMIVLVWATRGIGWGAATDYDPGGERWLDEGGAPESDGAAAMGADVRDVTSIA